MSPFGVSGTCMHVLCRTVTEIATIVLSLAGPNLIQLPFIASYCRALRLPAVQEKLKFAQEDKANAEKLVSDIKMQTKNLEESYDSLMREYSKLQHTSRGSPSDKKGR
jgi:hypothetical protein